MIGWIVLAVFCLALFGLAFAGSARTTRRDVERNGDLDAIANQARGWTSIT